MAVSKFEESVCVATRTIYLGGTINERAAREVIQGIHSLSHKKAPITLIINSGGGHIDDGMAIYDAIQHSPCPVIGKVVGICMSAALTILQACSLRLLSQNAVLMIHDGETAISRGHTAEVIQVGRQLSRDLSQFYKLMSEKTGLPVSKLKRMSRFSTYLYAQDAVKHGFADGILTLPQKQLLYGKAPRRRRAGRKAPKRKS